MLVSSCFVVGLLGGCKKKEVEYEILNEETTQINIDEISIDFEAPYKSDSKFEETLKLENTTITIDASVEIPINKNFGVYDAVPKILSDEDYMQLVNESFGGKIYDIDNPPKSELHAEVRIQEIEYKNNMYDEIVEYYYDYCKDEYDNAPDNWKESSYNPYRLGLKKNDIMYCFAPTFDGRGYELSCDKEILYYSKGYENGLLNENDVYRINGEIEVDENSEGIEKYIKTAALFMQDTMKLDDFYVTSIKKKSIIGTYIDQERVVDYGYIITFCREIDGVICDGTRYQKMHVNDESDSFDDYLECVTVEVNPYYDIVYAKYSGAIEIKNKTVESVNIIDFDTAKLLVIDELITHPRLDYSKLTYDSQTDEIVYKKIVDKYDYMTLEYFRIDDENNQYKIIPVWCLRSKDIGDGCSGVIINAIDGSIVNID